MGSAGGAGGRVALAMGTGVSDASTSGVSVSSGTSVAAAVTVDTEVAIAALVAVAWARGVKVGRGVLVGISVGLLEAPNGSEPHPVTTASVAKRAKTKTNLLK